MTPRPTSDDPEITQEYLDALWERCQPEPDWRKNDRRKAQRELQSLYETERAWLGRDMTPVVPGTPGASTPWP